MEGCLTQHLTSLHSTRMGGWHTATTSHGGPQISTPRSRVKNEGYARDSNDESSLSTASESSKHAHHTQVLHNGWGRGMHKRNGSDSMGTGTTL